MHVQTELFVLNGEYRFNRPTVSVHLAIPTAALDTPHNKSTHTLLRSRIINYKPQHNTTGHTRLDMYTCVRYVHRIM